MPRRSLISSSDPRVVYPNQRLQCDLYIAVILPPPSSPDDDPIIVVGTGEYTILELAAATWSATYPGFTGAVDIYAAPLADAAVVGRVMEGRFAGVGMIPEENRYRLASAKIVPVPEPPPPPWEPFLHPLRSGQFGRLVQQFADSGAPHARVVVSAGLRASTDQVRQQQAGGLAQHLRKVAQALELPVTAVMRRSQVYLSRTDLEEPTVYKGGEPNES